MAKYLFFLTPESDVGIEKFLHCLLPFSEVFGVVFIQVIVAVFIIIVIVYLPLVSITTLGNQHWRSAQLFTSGVVSQHSQGNNRMNEWKQINQCL
jgi:hypothetical protein